MHWVSLNWVLKCSCITLLAEQQALAEAVCICCEHYDFNNVWETHILDNNAPYQKSCLGFECVRTKEKAKGQTASWCKFPVYTTWKCQSELWTVWPGILSLLTFSLTVSCACPACCQATGVAASWAGEMASMHAEGEEREEICPPRLHEDFFGDFVLQFKCKNGLDPFWFCFSDHH